MRIETAKKRYPFLLECEYFTSIVQTLKASEFSYRFFKVKEYDAFIGFSSYDGKVYITWLFDKWIASLKQYKQIDSLNETPKWFTELYNQTKEKHFQLEKMREVLK